MGDVEIISETPINAYQLKEELKNIKKRDKELNFRASKTEDYLNAVLDLKAAEDLYKKIEGLKIPRLKDVHIHKLVELLPQTPQDVKVVLQGYTLNITNDSMKKIVDAINGFSEK